MNVARDSTKRKKTVLCRRKPEWSISKITTKRLSRSSSEAWRRASEIFFFLAVDTLIASKFLSYELQCANARVTYISAELSLVFELYCACIAAIDYKSQANIFKCAAQDTFAGVWWTWSGSANFPALYRNWPLTSTGFYIFSFTSTVSDSNT